MFKVRFIVNPFQVNTCIAEAYRTSKEQFLMYI